MHFTVNSFEDLNGMGLIKLHDEIQAKPKGQLISIYKQLENKPQRTDWDDIMVAQLAPYVNNKN